MKNLPKPKRGLFLTLTVLENRDSSFGNSKEILLSGSTCTCTCTCCSGDGSSGSSGGGGTFNPDEPPVAE